MLNVVLAMAVCLYIDWLVRDEVFTWSLGFIRAFKRDYDLVWFFKYGHYFVSTLSYTGVMTLTLVLIDQSHVFIIVMAQCLGGMTVIAFEKILIRAPRPFFVDPDIPIGECKFAEFGSPSGHSLVAGICYTTTAVMFLKYYKASKKTHIMTYILVVLPILLYNGLARVYDGMHTFD